MISRIPLAHLPTPLWRNEELDRLVGAEVWVKRDDMTGGAEAGNKIRKLEYLLYQARHRHSDVVITCGGIQSNHARATALLCRQLGIRPVLLLRTATPSVAPEMTGNVLLDRLAGAEIRLITPDEYKRRGELMQQAAEALAAKGAQPYVIPEGGSNGLGALGYVRAMQEVKKQLEAGLGGGRSFDAVVHACGSGGTGAGVALGASRFGVANVCLMMAVCDDKAYFETVVTRIMDEARAVAADLGPSTDWTVYDDWKGPAYSVASSDQKQFIVDVARRTGLILDPVYSGKALYGLAHLNPRPRRVLFLHTGGLPGLLAQHSEFL
jgi:D-cysteine desulfhydrase